MISTNHKNHNRDPCTESASFDKNNSCDSKVIELCQLEQEARTMTPPAGRQTEQRSHINGAPGKGATIAMSPAVWGAKHRLTSSMTKELGGGGFVQFDRILAAANAHSSKRRM